MSAPSVRSLRYKTRYINISLADTRLSRRSLSIATSGIELYGFTQIHARLCVRSLMRPLKNRVYTGYSLIIIQHKLRALSMQ
jgi:hypothetical protein